ncbi:MAG: hypothetical protein JO257_02360 [Deltaproteobacteria bacterium]|nr:hypothetical protein [Deltaproteobacteria bacterium]
MRHILIALAFVAISTPAHAEDDDEDAYFAAFGKHTLAAGFGGHGGRIDGHGEGGMGAMLELGYGRGRWQYTAEGDVESSDLRTTEMTTLPGRRLRGALGVRWLARQFIPVDPLGVEMYLHAAAGLSSYRWMNERSQRPDLTVGVGSGVRRFGRHDIFVRLDVDLVFSKGDAGFAAGVVAGW